MRFDAGMLRVSSLAFERRLSKVVPADWKRRTPCDDWDVRALTEHVVRGLVGYAGLLDGADGPTLVRDPAWGYGVLEPDPITAFRRAAAALEVKFAEPGAMARAVAHPAGTITGYQLYLFRLVDNAVHAWDLAVATGQAAQDIDARLLTYLLDRRHVWTTGIGAQYFSPVADRGDATALERMLSLTGRTAIAPERARSLRSNPGASHLAD